MYLKLRKECFTFLKVTWSKWAFYLLYRSCVRIYTDSDFWFSWKRQRNKIWTPWNRRNRFSIFLPRFSAELWTFVFRFVFWLHIKIRLTKSNTVQTDWFRPWLMEGSSSGGVLSTSIINLCLLIRVYLTFFFVVSELLKAKNMFLNTLRTFH